MALGAGASRVLGLVVGRVAVYVALGLVLGMTGAWVLSAVSRALLFQESPHDPVVYGIAAATLLVVGVVAALIPARRAASVNPLATLGMD